MGLRVRKHSLRRTIDGLAHQTGLAEPMAFLYWFLRARFGIQADTEIRNIICDGTGDKGIDAVYVDQAAKMVFIVQSKYTKTFGAGHVDRGDIRRLCATKRYFADAREFNAALKSAKEDTRKHLRSVLQLARIHGFKQSLVLASTRQRPRGNFWDILEDYSIPEERFQIFALPDVIRLREEEMRGQAPPTSPFELEYDRSYSLIKVARHDVPAISWTVVVTAGELRRIAVTHEDQIFRKNVRGFLGENRISKEVTRTLVEQPEHFWFFNNGITILADRVHEVAEASKLRLENAHVVNGCQTMKTLQRAPILRPQLRKALLPVRVIVPRDPGNAQSFVGKTIISQNSTNPILPRDLKSNDPMQVGLQWAFRERGYFLEIKRGYEYRRLPVALKKKFPFKAISNEQLALARLAASEPDIAKAKRAELFEEPLYEQVFVDGASVDDYLLTYYLLYAVVQSYRGRGGPFHELTIRTFKPQARLHALFVLASSIETQSIQGAETTHEQVVAVAEKDMATYGGVGFLESLRKPSDLAFEICYDAFIKGQKQLAGAGGELEETVEITPGNFFTSKNSTILVKRLMRARRKQMAKALHRFWRLISAVSARIAVQS